MERVGTNSRAFLFLQAKRRVYRCQFTKDLTHIGSHSDNDIVIRDPSVQSEHARISKANGVYTLRPISGAELRVNGEEVDTAYELENGDWLEVGDVSILFAREFAESPVTIHLLIRRPGEPPMGFWTSKSTIVIGREKGDVIIDDPLLSKVHTIIENFCIGGWFVLDARSERGTAVNGQSIDARHSLRDGDVVSLGGLEIEFRSRPFDNPTGQEAARLAQERVEQLRALDAQDSLTEEQKRDLVPRNPYQRYPSQLPEERPVPAPKEMRDDSPASIPGSLPSKRKSWSSRPHTAASVGRGGDRQRHTHSAPAPSRPSKRSLKAGLETGIFQSQTGAVSDRRSRNEGQRRSTPANQPAPESSQSRQPVHLPTLKPRDGWGDPSAKRTFAERSEQNTRLSFGNAQGSGLWYLPHHEEDEPVPRPSLEAPIIAARGDKVPTVPPQVQEESRPKKTNRAMIRRRTESSGLRPMQARSEAPLARVKTAPPMSRKATQRPQSEAKEHYAGLSTDAAESPGRRPDALERWYAPGNEKKPIRQRRGHKAWYLPGDVSDQDDDDKLDLPKIDRSGGGRTQVFDSEEY